MKILVLEGSKTHLSSVQKTLKATGKIDLKTFYTLVTSLIYKLLESVDENTLKIIELLQEMN